MTHFFIQGLSVAQLTCGSYHMNSNFMYFYHCTSVFMCSALQMLVALWFCRVCLSAIKKLSHALVSGTSIIDCTRGTPLSEWNRVLTCSLDVFFFLMS